ncbi:MAG TPA: hypothetical protein VFB07_07545 [Vicinamibacterales bacterium]|nr:hypothetical protein [Vicinamibacterales bacterium]
MALILAIESDKRQVNYLTAMVRGKLHAELVLGETAEGALERLGDRVPDLILTSALLSPRDEQALGDRLRKLNGVAAHVQMLTLPVFAPPSRPAQSSRGGVLSALLGDRSQAAGPDGCDPAVFAEQCKEYLRRSAEDRDARRHEHPPELPVTIETAAAIEPERTAAADTAADPEDTGVDIDLSDLLADESSSTRAAAIADDDEPAIYELSADALDIDLVAAPADELIAAPADELDELIAAPADEAPAAPEADEDEFDDFQKVIDALKRESAQVRVPRERKPEAPAVQTAAVQTAGGPGPSPKSTTAVPTPAPEPAAAAAIVVPPAIARMEPPRRRLRPAADEWGVFDPMQAGMAALYERLEQLTQDKEPH